MTASKIVAAAASGVGGAGLDVDEVFSCHLYKGNGSTQTITNGIDLSGEGGLAWVKQRDGSSSQHALFDTENGTLKALASSSSGALATETSVTAFNSNGFSLAAFNNTNARNYVSWTFRKAEKFFDIVTYTGNGTENRKISHNLGSVPGMIIVKKTSASGGWRTYHRGANGGTNPEQYYADLDSADSFSSLASVWYNTAPTATEFTLGDQIHVNQNGQTFIAYIFAHNNNDGGFGPDSDQDIIKCGSYTGNGASGNAVNLGFEPQWLMVKNASSSNQNWTMFDNMRGVATGGIAAELFPNDATTERNAFNIFNFNTTGFETESTLDETNKNGDTFVYMAIRRGSLNVPDDATKVFALDYANGSDIPAFQSGFPIDMGLLKQTTGTGTFRISSRLTQGEYLETSETNAASANTNYVYDYQNGFFAFAYSSAYVGWMWKRAPSYFDVVAYTGDFTTSNSIAHNLGVAPEMMWIRRRDAVAAWQVPALITSSGYRNMRLDTTYEGQAISSYSDYTGLKSQPTSTNFVLGQNSSTNVSGGAFIAYLFATATGVSKVGSVSHTSGSATNVDCGFSSGARFVLIKQTDDTGAWYVFDSVRGIIAENDAGLYLNVNTAQQSADWIDPLASGFTMTSGAWNTGTYLFYAIA